MNHPIHPEERVYAGLVRGAEVPAVEPKPIAWGVFTSVLVSVVPPEDEWEWTPYTLTHEIFWTKEKAEACIVDHEKRPTFTRYTVIPLYTHPASLPARTLDQVDAHHALLNADLDSARAEIERLNTQRKELQSRIEDLGMVESKLKQANARIASRDAEITELERELRRAELRSDQ